MHQIIGIQTSVLDEDPEVSIDWFQPLSVMTWESMEITDLVDYTKTRKPLQMSNQTAEKFQHTTGAKISKSG